MAQITYGYTPTTGAVFSPSGFNADIYSNTSGVSVYGELNGHLQDDNFDATFLVEPQHVRPNEGFVARSDGQLDTVEYFDLLFGTSTNTSENEWIKVCGTRLYVPWEAQAVLFTVSAFLTNQRSRETTDPHPAVAVWGGPEMYVRMNIDGTGVDHTRRSLPYTQYPINNPGDAEVMRSREDILSHHFDLTHLATGGSRIDPGWHDVSLEIFIPRTQGVENLTPQYENAPKLAEYLVRHKIKFGIRKASIIAF